MTTTNSNKSIDTNMVLSDESGDIEKYGSDSVDSKDEAAEDESNFPSGVALWSILGPVTIAYFLVFLDMCVVSTATPSITQRFNSLVDVGWYGGAYQLGSSALQPLTGKIYSHFNIKWSFLAFFFLFELGSVICGAAVSSPMFIVGRAIAGAGSSGIGNGAMTIISVILPRRKQAQFLGINMGIGQLGIALGPIIGGAFTQNVSWRWCFYINLPIGGALAILLFLFKVPEPTDKLPARQVLGTAIKSLDLPGFMLISPAAVMFLLALQYGGTVHPWNSSVVIGLFVGAAVTFIIFLIWEYRQGDGAMVPFAMIKKRIVWSAAGNLFFLLGAILVAEYYLAIFFQTVLHNSPIMSAEILGYYLPWNLGGSAVTSIGYGLMSLIKPTTISHKWLGYQVLYGVGSGAMTSAVSLLRNISSPPHLESDFANFHFHMKPYIAIQNLVPPPQIPIAMAIIIFCQNMGGAVFLIVANSIFTNGLRVELQKRYAEIGVNPDILISTGLNSIRSIVSGDKLTAALECYTTAISHVMYLGIGVSVATFAFGWGLGWVDIRKAKKLQAIKGDAPAASNNEDVDSTKKTTA
ncbi:Major facilitator superfamily domain, general substrate transporter [Penicillium italicum]|uniref:Major facilitator superfamily domain, general substrate transporter n=1 Tax=Penicillium italicum TaxID=40296 RepID=A0A0A2L2H5_PENIT|nr:Major facilitator superfamily domain, general substrate transporter [Penicillium italicum]